MRKKGAKSGIHGNCIDKTQFENLCKIHCTRDEICAVFGITDFTLYAWIKQQYGEDVSLKEIMSYYAAGGKASLRRIQWKQAETNPAMAMFLGKNYLGQSDRPAESEQELENATNILISIKKAVDNDVE